MGSEYLGGMSKHLRFSVSPFPHLYCGENYEFTSFSKRAVVRVKGSSVGEVPSAVLGANRCSDQC